MDISRLAEVIEAAARESPLADLIEKISVEPDRDEDDADFLRVSIRLREVERQNVDDLEAILERIEDAVAPVDPRYPSVRFLDAA